jgi:putative ABC transport system permease protein
MSIDCWRGDLRVAWRRCVSRPGFSLLVILTLALGFGGGAAVFAVADAVLLKPLPYREPARLVFLWQTLPRHNVFELEPTPADFVAWKTHLKSVSEFALVQADSVTITGAGDAERVRAARVTASVFGVLGLTPHLGRAFDAAEDSVGAGAAAILSDGLWRRRFGADPAVIGRTIDVNGEPHAVVGILPPGALLPGPLAASSEPWLAGRFSAAEWANATSHNYTVFGRLTAGVTLAAAAAELEAFAASMAADDPESYTGLGARLVTVTEDTVRGIRPALLVLVGGVLLLIVATCANVSTLLLVHASSRQQDAAVRTALGASRARLLTESSLHAAMLSAGGGAVGLWLGRVVLAGILPAIAASIPPHAAARIDGRIGLMSLVASIVIGASLGMLASAVGWSDRIAEALRGGSRASAAPHAARTRSALVVSQIALAVVLLATAGLMIRSLVRLTHVAPGFVADRVLTFRVSLEGARYDTAPSRSLLMDDVIRRFESQPGIERAAATSRLPLGGSRGANSVEIQGRPAAPGEMPIVDQRHVTPAYFQAMGIRRLDGRVFGPRDDDGTEQVAIVNRTMAQRFWPTGNPIDQRVRLAAGFDSGRWMRIVGVVDDVRHVALSRSPVAEMYRPYAQAPVRDLTVVLKTRGDPDAAAGAARATIQAVDRNLPVYDLRTMDERVAASFAQLRATMVLLAITAAIAASLAAVAIYGSIWYSVSQRVPELGLRLALGASRASVFGSVLGGAFRLSAIGAAVGAAGTLAAGSVVRALLFETSPTDPVTYAVVVAAIVGLTTAAAIVPARRAMSVDPLVALRNE